MTDAFSKLHPTVNFLFFAFVLALSMFIMNPICLALSLVCAFVNAVYLNGIKTVKLCLKFILPISLLIILINPVFNHQGVTIIAYFPWDNPLTLESIVYGAASSALLSAVVLWFSVFNSVITSDKIVYLFGKIIPSLSLVLSMSLRFIPKFSAQLKNVRNAQRCIGRDVSDGSAVSRIKNGIRIISIMLSWSMENAIETADSMKSRGFGLKGRTAYSIYKFDRRDLVMLIIVALLGVSVSVSAIMGVIDFTYYPSIKGSLTDVPSLIVFFLYGILMLIPTILNIGEGIKWKHLRSVI